MLVEEKTPRIGDEVLDSLYVLSKRVYERLPGLGITTTKLDDDGDVVTVTKTRKVASTIASDETLSGGVWTQIMKGPGDAYSATEIKEVRAIPGTPIVETEKDDDGITVTTSRRRQAISSITVSEGVSGGTWTRVKMKAITELVGWEITITRAIPGAAITTTKLDDDGDVVTVTRTKKEISAITSDETLSGGIWTQITKGPGDAIVAEEIKEERAIPGTPIVETKIDDDGITVTISRRRQVIASITTSEAMVSTTLTIVSMKAITELVGWEITTTRALPGNVITTWMVDGETETPVRVDTQLVSKASSNYNTTPPTQTAGYAIE